MPTEYFFYVALFLFGLVVRTGYELLKEKGMVNPENRILFVSVIGAMILMWTSWFSMCPLDPLRFALPQVVCSFGLIIQVLGLCLAIIALVQLRGLENIRHLVTTGIFSKLRHPMYIGFISWIVGATLYYGAAASLAVGLLGIGNILYWRRLEETRLELAYGEEYLRYRERTWW